MSVYHKGFESVSIYNFYKVRYFILAATSLPWISLLISSIHVHVQGVWSLNLSKAQYPGGKNKEAENISSKKDRTKRARHIIDC